MLENLTARLARIVKQVRGEARLTEANIQEALREVRDLPEMTLERIVHFFEHYKDLEKGKWVKVEGWQGADAARREIAEGAKRFKALPPKERPPF